MLVLHVEDDASHAFLTQRFLKNLPIELVHITTAQKALTWLESNQPALIMTDVALPGGLNGLNFAEMVRQIPSFEHTPVIFMSAVDDLGAMWRAEQLGALAYMIKPIKPLELLALIEDILYADDSR